ncbi:MAG: hypothetical protein P1P88_14575 [Bacteroidales bacterium]|nr:hypothetical protein [Bacteroidales bacterium]
MNNLRKYRIRFFGILLPAVLFFAGCNEEKNIEFQLSDNWEFAKEGSQEYLPATVPGYVHTDLLKNKIIDSLYFGTNPRKYNFVGDTGWVYKTAFFLSNDQIAYKNKTLLFEGVDTYSDIYLNDSLILSTNNMFLAFEKEITDLVKVGSNYLEVRIKSPFKEAQKVIDNYEFYTEGHFQADKELPMKFVRKAQYQFGWDWACPLVPSGIYKPVKIKLWNDYKIVDAYIRLKEISDKRASLEAELEIQASQQTMATFDLFVEDSKAVSGNEFQLDKGRNIVRIPFEIDNPKRWWPNGMGAQHLYSINIRANNRNTTIDEITERIGLRTVEFVNEYDKYGKSYYFKVNGVPVFMKGANYVPIDAMLPSVSPERYKKFLQAAVDANMNMLRVWGGGIYEYDIFYNLCDSLGILVYQDFMFASRMPAASEEFCDLIEHEAVHQVKRLRNHPCLAIWAGSNEVESAWFEGFMPKSYPKELYDIDHKKIFDTILPQVVKQYHPAISYVRSSPTTGTDSILVNTPGYGDTHAWSVWFGKIDFDKAEYSRLSRFISEYGFIGYPAHTSLKKYIPAEEMDTASNVFKFRDAYNGIQDNIKDFIKRYYPQPQNLMEFTYISGIMQAEAMRVSNELYRRSKPYCMGALLWQFNDVWPVASWSMIDYYGQWKPIMYRTRDSFAPLIISTEEQNDTIIIHVVSDLQKDISSQLKLKLMNFEGMILYESSMSINIKANKSQIVEKINLKKLVEKYNKNSIVLDASIEQGNSTLASNLHYFSRIKDLRLPEVKITSEITIRNERTYIILSSDKLTKNLYLIDSKGELHFSNNYFDLQPGKRVEISLDKGLNEDDLKKRLSFFSLNNIIHRE